MTYEIQQTRWDRVIRRVSGSIGPGSRAADTISEVMPTLDLENMPAELLVLGGTRLAMGFSSQPGAGGLFSQSMLRNPGQSGAIITVLEARFSAPTAQTIVGGPTLNTFAVSGVDVFADTRLGLVSPPTGVVLADQLLVTGPDFYRFEVNGVDDTVWTPPKAVGVLGPGSAMALSCTVLGATFSCSWTWQERSAEESELSL